jgi:hypothetical protein
MRRWPIAAGSAAGALAWIYDHDFFLNAGGPAAPLSTAILRATGLEHGSALVIVFWPLLVLALSGAVLGFAFSRLRAM